MTDARLCDALDAAIHLVSGDALHLAAHVGPIAPDPVLLLTEETLGGRAIRQRQAMHLRWCSRRALRHGFAWRPVRGPS